ncbi:MAG: aminopeptidase P family protein [Zymomonas mobilis subsp. pomaceae]|uniref:Xaa-Pro aminopeptidase n=1 Tax=Zymomonas mobilis subsp. pomaceae (strain ATCC 29192 / DSM 22645 / JCM 10191 / CCUG 17912 / NBRC 13757 / NCIMB 11200 / NRRL B-4491 / Barker I) TaxID=579138 RepID=F8ES53_ZYMMT|nr:aminopeptidase P family protein [Zymomonas mobilis]AEI37628.1 Xaa-Pro aminopeptidase [Zymomonas mobilis subsp. pomaceae ATCC 29192]MDX5948996.1 aminopeptidase P family protein [Zymomonas mobilis subsp. pomaceae]GEB88801.1 aminopeptidase [Zymomonas mobilis subsp. pomaceae]
MSSHMQRLKALREELHRQNLQGFFVPLTDEHMSEYVGAYAQRLAWLTGFEGSAGSAVVLEHGAAIFVDGRYTIQVREQTDPDIWSYGTPPRDNPVRWAASHLKSGDRVGYDPWLASSGWEKSTRLLLESSGIHLIAVESNPIDNIWQGRPLPSQAPVFIQPDNLAGCTSAKKRQDIAQWLEEIKADSLVLTALDSIAWIFNIRGRDVSCTPVALAFAFIHKDASADLFIDLSKIDEALKAHLGPDIRIHDRSDFAAALKNFSKKYVALDPEHSVMAISALLKAGNAQIIEVRDPVILKKAIKNATEIQGHRHAQLRDSTALTRFLYWLSQTAPKGSLTELSAAEKLLEFRKDTGALVDVSFETISAVGPHSAIPHYRVTEASNLPLKNNEIYLVDSGGQYQDGTTDVTRTVIIGTPTQEMKQRFTLVLKGHIALAQSVFPKGVCGAQLDSFARQYLWQAGLDYAHGTGHGVGAFLSVHEGPQRISPSGGAFSGGSEVLQSGMIISNEPGYYKTGAYGIRIENLLLVKPVKITNAEKECLGFETLNFAPIDRHLIDISLLSESDINWLDNYHADVRQRLSPFLSEEESTWLKEMTLPLAS